MKYIITLITCISMGVSADGEIGGVTHLYFVSSDDSTAFNFQRQFIF